MTVHVSQHMSGWRWTWKLNLGMVYFMWIFLRIATLLLFVCVFANTALARELRVGIGFALPPYVISNEDKGLEVDIIRESLAKAGHTARFFYLPNLRLPVEFSQGRLDCVVANVAYDIEKDSGRKGYPSLPTIAFQNYAISLEGNDAGVASVAELRNKHVLAFNNAAKYLGAEFANMAHINPRYTELADQSLQVRMLYSERVEVVISDKRIFQWWRNKLLKSAVVDERMLSRNLVFSPIFPPAPRWVTFATAADRDAFNKGLAELRASGRFDAIVEAYVGSPAAQ